jgi:hypothetical protein
MIARTTMGIIAAAAYNGALLACFLEKFQSDGRPPFGLIGDSDTSASSVDCEVDVVHSDELPQ